MRGGINSRFGYLSLFQTAGSEIKKIIKKKENDYHI